MQVRKGFYLVLFSLTAIALLTAGVNLTHFIACEGQPFNDNLPPTPAQQILGERLIGQSFVAPRDGLNRIDLFLQTYQRQNTRDISLLLLELPPSKYNFFEGREIFTTIFNAATVEDRTWRTFTFPTISDSAQKQYLILLNSPDSKDGNAITVGGIQQDVYAPGLAVVYAPDLAFSELTPVNGDIMFRTCYEMMPLEKLQVLVEQMTRSRPMLWSNIGFYIINLTIYILLLIGFLGSLIKFG